MKKNYLFLFLLTTFSFLHAQNNFYYYYKGQKKYLTVDKKSFNIFTNAYFQKLSTTNIGVQDYTLLDDATSENAKYAQIELINEPNNFTVYNKKLNEVKQLPNVEYVGLFFENGEGDPVGISKHFYVKLKNINDYNVLQQTALQKNVEIVKQVPNMPQWYILAVSAGNSNASLEMCNQFYETGLFEAVDPAFMLRFSNDDEVDIEEVSNKAPIVNGIICSNDSNFNLLWGLKNTTNPEIDINACEAWWISQGKNISVAVVDQGIYLPHLDLSPNIGSAGYDAKSGNDGSVYIAGNTHGTKVAGVISAVRNNNRQIVGVAPKSTIIPISHDFKKDENEAIVNSTFSAQLASGISWAWNSENADIINNSWYSNSGWLDSQLLEESITNAIDYGRDGKGCVIVFSAGNNNSNVLYPGSFDDRIVTVGAIGNNGIKADFSSFGSKLDVVAPGKNIWSTSPNQNISEDQGTSFAAPYVSGLAALILSVNPCLTGQQVRDIIEQTSQKTRTDLYSYDNNPNRSNGTWNNQMGYGLIDAYAAVLMARNTLSTNPCNQGFQEPLQLSTLESIAPNPASHNIEVNYILREARSASLMIVSQSSNNSTNTYDLDLNTTQTSISISNYLSGQYIIALVVNGEVVDSKALIKQ
ncbi:S8 family peptidase [Epilithonimonas hispanica]|uniref:Peptidase S8/S53 domain-containing protein n=1 Tax=Epilithonimonas hispanica TaxID=358687 RepID=A0A3D9D147_9FLAO|nr:S8 family serine peptidase [Epilithonimonas hispanica]REC71736.1 hypothetical protein DRF58_05160 [Epilithonimonas hispanica]